MCDIKNLRSFLAVLVLFCGLWGQGGFVFAATAAQTPSEWYQEKLDLGEDVVLPEPVLEVAQALHKDVFTQLKIPAILAILAFEYEEHDWPEFSGTEQRRFLKILRDRKLILHYSGLQSTKVTSAGAQIMDDNLVKFHYEGWYFQGGPRSAYQIAQIIAHELVHIDQLRETNLPNFLYLWYHKNEFEIRPTLAESQLNAQNFTEEEVNKVAVLIQKIAKRNAFRKLQSAKKSEQILGQWQLVKYVTGMYGEKFIHQNAKDKHSGYIEFKPDGSYEERIDTVYPNGDIQTKASSGNWLYDDDTGALSMREHTFDIKRSDGFRNSVKNASGAIWSKRRVIMIGPKALMYESVVKRKNIADLSWQWEFQR